MWRYRSVVSRLNQLSKLYSTRISYCDIIPIDPELMFMKKTNADILRLKKQMFALESARVKLHEQIQETIQMIKSLSNVNAQQNKMITATAPGKAVLQEQDKKSISEQPNIIYIDEGLVNDNKPTNVPMVGHINTASDKVDQVGNIEQLQFQKAENQLEIEAKRDAESEEADANQQDNELLLNAEKETTKELSDENETKSGMVSMVANKEVEVEGKASIIDKAAEDEELIKVILKDESETESKESAKEESDSETVAEEDKAEEELGIDSNELEAATQAVKLNAGQQTKTIKYTDENILDIFKKATKNAGGTVVIIQKQANQKIQEITLLEEREQNDDDSEPPSSQLEDGQGGQNVSESMDGTSLTTTANEPTVQEVHNSKVQQEQQQQQQQQQQDQEQAQEQEQQAKPAVAHFQALDKVNQLLADKNINLKSGKPIIIILDKPKMEEKATKLLPEANVANKNVSLESETYYKEDTLFYQESITQSNAGTEFNQIYSTIAPSNDKNNKPEETIVMVSKYVPNVEQAQEKGNEMMNKMQTQKVYNNIVPKCLSPLKGMEDEQWEFEQHSADAKAHAKPEAEESKAGPIVQ